MSLTLLNQKLELKSAEKFSMEVHSNPTFHILDVGLECTATLNNRSAALCFKNLFQGESVSRLAGFDELGVSPLSHQVQLNGSCSLRFPNQKKQQPVANSISRWKTH